MTRLFSKKYLLTKAAAQWIARCDRGLSVEEEAAFARWLSEDPRHSAAIAQLRRVWRGLDRLHGGEAASAAEPDPDLLVRESPRRSLWPFAFAAAAALAAGVFTWRMSPSSARPDSIARPVALTQMALEDGTLVELNVGAKLEADFTRDRRSVRLVGGEAHFIVAKEPGRPFVVASGRFAVRAVGTAFAVKPSADGLSVLVTEGEVSVDQLAAPDLAAPILRAIAPVSAGQLATVRGASEPDGEPTVAVRTLTSAETERALTWQTMRLEFVATPLKEIVAKFNRYNSRKLVVADEATAELLVGGSFRADNIASFVRLMEIGFGVHAQDDGDAIVLHSQ